MPSTKRRAVFEESPVDPYQLLLLLKDLRKAQETERESC